MKSVVVSSPATVANVGPGFDILSFALEGPRDIVKVVLREDSSDIRVKSLDPRVPSGEANVAYAVAKAFLEEFGLLDVGLDIVINKKVPPAKGLGSSAASAVATAKALSTLFGIELNEKDLLSIAVRGEEHASKARHFDNVAASLLGGFVISNPRGDEFIRIEPPMRIPVGIVVPLIELPSGKTEYARSLLPRAISLEDQVLQSFNVAKLVYALLSGDLKKLGEAVSFDLIAEPRRSQIIPYYNELKKLALELGALGFNISGAGPSVFFFTESSEKTAQITEELKRYLENKGVSVETIVSEVSSRGAKVVDFEDS
ncbi:MAG: homoserine kinase [Acidilobaceae archaeon]